MSAKSLAEMSLEELWQLFPIVLTPHRHEWKEWAAGETDHLSRLLSDFRPVINHVGSTAIPDIQAKPIIDILVEIAPCIDRGAIAGRMEKDGYICMAASTTRLSFNKGYTPAGYAGRVFHIHLRRPGDNDEIYFRDYLIAHPDAARAYEALKLSLLPAYRNDRDGYTAAKTPFVESVMKLARPNADTVTADNPLRAATHR